MDKIECVERIGKSHCRQQAFVDTDRCYYHDKLHRGLLENSDSVVFYEEDDDF